MKIVLALIAGLLAQPALALSCMPFTPMHGWHEAANSSLSYVFVKGQVSLDSNLLPRWDPDNPTAVDETTRLPAHITGKALTRAGLTAPFDEDFMLSVDCFGENCAGLRDGQTYYMFLYRTDQGGFAASVHPCDSLVWSHLKPRVIEQFVACLKGEYCPKP